MKVAYFDCIAGASGDMILGALVDAGLPLDVLNERLQALKIPDFHLEAKKVLKNAFSATKVDVMVADNVPERHLGDIIAIVQESDLPQEIKHQAIAIFEKIGRAEASIHGSSLDHVHLHELGGVDTIVDVVGALVGLQALDIVHIVCSPIPLGRGTIRGAHGIIPLPAPATVALLKGVPVTGSPLNMETVTPTGAALLASLADAFGAIPDMTFEVVGYGAGSRDLPIPNVLRILIGTSETRPSERQPQPHQHSHDHPHPEGAHAHPHEPSHEHSHSMLFPSPPAHAHQHTHHAADIVIEPAKDQRSCLDTDHLTVLETNIDDLNPEFYAHIMDKLFAAGALDVFLIPIQMKKNRPATLLRVLCQPDGVKAMNTILFHETSTLGIREQKVDRHALPRKIHTVETTYGPVKVKVADLGEGKVKSAPEYEDCHHLAQQHGVPIREVYLAAQQAAQSKFSG